MTMRLLLMLAMIISLSVLSTRLSMVYAQSTNATAVLGQSDLFSSFSDPFGAGTDPSSLTPFGVRVRADDSVLGGVYVVDRPSHRVLYFPPGATAATRVYGQPDMYSNQSNRGAPNPSADSLNIPVGVEVASDGVYICDNGNHRVLFYPGISTTATRVYGQGGNFSSGTAMTVSADSLFFPRGLFLDSANNLYVADWYNHRVLFFPAGSTTATRVYGQGGRFTTRDEPLPPTVDSLNTPNSVTISNTGVYIADYGNNRVLYYAGASTTASIAFGHSGSFVTRDEESPPSAQSVNYPTSVTLDINCNLYVTSYWNHRVLVFPPGSTTATRVYGQLGDFNSSASNNGGLGPWSLFNPFDAAIGDNELLITDVRNNRVLKYPLNDGTAAPNRNGPCSRNNTFTAETTTTPPPTPPTTTTTLSSLSPTTLSPPVSSASSFSSPSSSIALMIAATLLFLFGFPSD